MGKDQHVVPDGNGGWNVKGEGNSRATANFQRQSDAVTLAKSIAKNQHSEELTHGRNGRIRDRSSYGNDPRRIKG